MSSQFQLLKSDIQAELAAIERIYGDLPPADVGQFIAFLNRLSDE
jgi:hypothetical protein